MDTPGRPTAGALELWTGPFAHPWLLELAIVWMTSPLLPRVLLGDLGMACLEVPEDTEMAPAVILSPICSDNWRLGSVNFMLIIVMVVFSSLFNFRVELLIACTGSPIQPGMVLLTHTLVINTGNLVLMVHS